MLENRLHPTMGRITSPTNKAGSLASLTAFQWTSRPSMTYDCGSLPKGCGPCCRHHHLHSPAASRLVNSIDLQNNRDITLHDINLKDHTIKTTVHRTDTVSVMVSCSGNPIPIDVMGLAKLTSGLTRVEEGLRMLHGFGDADGGDGGNGEPKRRGNRPSPLSKHRIPDHMSWTVTMWHFGQDSLTGYSGQMFEVP